MADKDKKGNKVSAKDEKVQACLMYNPSFLDQFFYQ